MAAISAVQKPAEEVFLVQLLEFVQSPSCKRLGDIARENEALRERLKAQEDANIGQSQLVISIQQKCKDGEEQASAQAKEMEKLKEEKKEADARLKAERSAVENAKESLKESNKKIETLEKEKQQALDRHKKMKTQIAGLEKSLEDVNAEKKELDKELSTLRASDSEKAARLSSLEKLEVKLHDFENTNSDELCRKLQGLFESLDKLIENQIGDMKDSPEAQTAWKKFIEHKAFDGADLPSPPMHTPNAKGMRRAGVLCICAWALETHIFQCTYLIDKNNQLSTMLDELADRDPERERRIRSILVSLQHDRDSGVVVSRVDSAINAVIECTSHFLNTSANDAHADFKTSLREIFTKASLIWRHVQVLKPKIKSATYERAEEAWKLVPLLKRAPSAAPTTARKPSQIPHSSGRADGVAVAKSLKKPVAGHPNAGPQYIMIVLWPAFLKSVDRKTEVLTKGYAVSDAELKEAREEEAKVQEARRAARHVSRMMGTGRRLSTSQNSDEQSNGGPSFLSQAVVSG